jgi:hypothetical protein
MILDIFNILAHARKANPPAPGEMGERNLEPGVEEVHFLRSNSFTYFA